MNTIEITLTDEQNKKIKSEQVTLEKFLLSVNGNESSINEINSCDAKAAVERNGYALQYVKEQTPDVCKAAVERNGYALRYVKEQTPDVCKAAVERNGDALQYVKEQTPDVCKAAVEQDGDALQYVKRATFETAKIILISGVKYALDKI